MKKTLYLLTLLALFSLTACGQVKTTNLAKKADIQPTALKNTAKIEETVPNFGNGLFYFAYGSNMSLARMTERCGKDNFVDLGKAQLPGYSFYFYGRGYANIRPMASQTIEGVLFQIKDACLKSLDRVEGYPNTYQRQAVKIDWKNTNVLAQVYIVEKDQTMGTPTAEYYQIVLSGAQEHNLSDSYINQIKALAE